ATGADPWRNLGKVFWGTGWILVFLAICNSIVANSNAAVNAATRVFYSLARNGVALFFGWRWGPLTGFSMIATMAVPVVIVVYMIVSVGCIVEYTGKRRSEF